MADPGRHYDPALNEDFGQEMGSRGGTAQADAILPLLTVLGGFADTHRNTIGRGYAEPFETVYNSINRWADFVSSQDYESLAAEIDLVLASIRSNENAGTIADMKTLGELDDKLKALRAQVSSVLTNQ